MKFPQTIKAGSAQVKIYAAPTRHGKKKYPGFLVRYHYNGRTIQRKFAAYNGGEDPEKFALAHAENAAERINVGSMGAFLMQEKDRLEFIAAREIVPEVSLVTVANFYRRHHPVGSITKTVSEVTAEMLVAKRQDKMSEEWLRELSTRLATFCRKFGALPINQLSGVEINDWLRARDIGGKTRNNYRACISTLVTFAKSKKYLTREFHELDYVPTSKVESKEIEIWTPADFVRWMALASEPLRRLFALGCFAGIRHHEARRLDWSHFKWEDGVIAVNATSSKVGERRLAPILPALKSWLEPIEETGRVIELSRTVKAIHRLAGKTGLKWKHNAPRHSFISYRVSELHDLARVADESGNSVYKIKTNYLKRVPEREAKEWFSLTRSRFTKLLQKENGAAITRRKPRKH